MACHVIWPNLHLTALRLPEAISLHTCFSMLLSQTMHTTDKPLLRVL